MTNHIVLFEPLIPANTGNIARTAAATNSVLHLIEPLGFSIDDKHVKRAGLDYWDAVSLVLHPNLSAFMETVRDQAHLFVVSKFAGRMYSDVVVTDPAADYYFLFGKETTGLPEPFMRAHADQAVRIPMTGAVRALNLSNAAALVVYEALRQQDFAGLEKTHAYPHDKLK